MRGSVARERPPFTYTCAHGQWEWGDVFQAMTYQFMIHMIASSGAMSTEVFCARLAVSMESVDVVSQAWKYTLVAGSRAAARTAESCCGIG